MKFLIAGFGSIGRRHFRNLRALGQNEIVLLRSRRSTLDDEEVAGYPVEMTIEAALAHRPDALIVANPTALHLDVAIPAAEAGCHVLMEKPISDSLEGVNRLREAAEQNQVQVMMGFQFRFHPGLARAKALIHEGAIGRVLTARAHWGEYLPDWHPWEDYRNSYAAKAELGGGVVRTLTHPIDYMRWLFGDVRKLWAFAGQISDLEVDVEDVGEIGLVFDSGVMAGIQVNYFQRPPRHQLEIVGTRGTIRWDNADGACHLWSADRAEWETYPLPDGFDRNDLFLAEMLHFIELASGNLPRTQGSMLADGIAAQELVAAVYEAARAERVLSFE